MKIEISAGAVIVRKKKNVWNVLLIRDMNGNLTFPKGLVEKNEESLDAAKREAREETGIRGLKFLAPLTPVTYWYVRGEKIKKTVHYFLFSSSGTEKLTPQKEEGISEVLWMPVEKAIVSIGYPKTNKPVLEEAMHTIKSQISMSKSHTKP